MKRAATRWLLALVATSGAACSGESRAPDTGDWTPSFGSSGGKRDGIWPDRLQHLDSWHANATGRDYGITIYYPPSYGSSGDRRYPVVYMQDGQNLFLDELSVSGVSWNVAGAMDEGAQNGSIPEALVVAVDNTDGRTDDYTPAPDPDEGGCNAAAYLSFLVDELKPVIDDKLRTLPDRDHTAIVGSSLGGVLAVYAGTARAQTFGLVGALSPATWWDNDWLLSHTDYAAPWYVYLDSGDSGPVNDDVGLTSNLAAGFEAAERAGEEVHVRHVVQNGAEHGEEYWRQRLPGALAFLLNHD